MRQVAAIVGVLILGVSSASADLLPGDILLKEHASVGPGPFYTATIPLFMTNGNIVGTEVSAITGGDFVGEVRTTVVSEPGTGFLGFLYVVELDDMSNTVPIVRATMNGWVDINITDAGADATGDSGTFDPDPEWLDGDPYSISRDPFTQGLSIQWRQAVGSGLIGTVIGPGDLSSQIFFTTTATEFIMGEIALIDTAQVGKANVLVPVPEAGSLALIVIGAACALVAHRRR